MTLSQVPRNLRKRHRKESLILYGLTVYAAVAGVFLVSFLIRQGLQTEDWPWIWFVNAGLLTAMILFFAGSCIRQRFRESHFGTSVRQQLLCALSQTEHRIRLLRTIAWWNLLPLFVAWTLGMIWVIVFIGTKPWLYAYIPICLAGFYGLRRLWGFIERKRYLPRQTTLLSLLEGLDKEG